MAHEIDQSVYQEGQAIYAVTPAWHGLGKVKPNTFSSAEAIQEIGLGFNVSKRVLFLGPTVEDIQRAVEADPAMSLPELPASNVPVPEYVATVRDDSNAVLGVVGKDFEPLQNVQMFSILDQAVAEAGVQVQYEAAGSLKGGRKVWALARLPEPLTIAQFEDGRPDDVRQYFLALNGHDGSRSASFFPTNTRVVCENTAQAAEMAAEGERKVTWKHTSNISTNIPNMVAAVKGCIADLRAWGSIARQMAEKEIQSEMETDTFQKLVASVIETTISGTSDAAKGRRVQALSLILGHFASGSDFMNPGDQPTIWRAYNAVSQWIEHEAHRYRSPENRFESLVIGTAAAMKSRAFRTLAGLLPKGGK